MLQTSAPLRRKLVLLGATALVAGLSHTSAFAQQAVTGQDSPTTAASVPATPAVPEASEQVEVTGTRIQTNNANSANPLTVITSKEIAQSSAQTIEDVLQKNPTFGTSGLYGATQNGGDGLSCTDIRNLGINRVLVLVDGHRFVHDSDGVDDCVNLNNIPLQMVDRIEVLKDGASATYGADAVSGVVNIILKKNFSGVTATLEGDLPTRGGGSTGELSVTGGTNFDKGNLTFSADYTNRAAVPQSRRNWAIQLDDADAPDNHSHGGSSFTPGAHVVGNTGAGSFGGIQIEPDGSTHPYVTANDHYNFAPQQDLIGGLEKESIGTTGHYDFNEYMTGFVQSFFTHSLTTEQLAPEPVYAVSSTALPDTLIIPAGNPYIPASLTGADVGNLLVRKRFSESGPRHYSQSSNTFQIAAGLRGTLPYDVGYEAYYNYGRSDNVIRTQNNVNVANLEQEFGYSYIPGANADFGTYDPTVCQASSGCVLSNPFNLSTAAVKYATYTQTDTSLFNIRDYGINLTKKDIYDLPYGPLGLAFGADHRAENGGYVQDNLVASGLTNEAPQPATQGGFNVTEAYAETRIPILADLPFAKELSVDLSGRYFSYNNFGSGETWKISGTYSPISDIRFRAAIGTSFRQPSVSELFAGQISSANPAIDPCTQISSYGSKAGAVAAKCASQGVPVGFASIDTQIATLIGGNPDLEPETARNETLGVVIKPRFLPNAALTVDYWRTKVDNSIGTIDTQTILDNCYTGNTIFCSQINARNPLTHLLTNIDDLNQNLGVILTNGIDIGGTYNLPLGEYGSLGFNNQLQYLFHYRDQNNVGGPFQELAGFLQTQNQLYSYPRTKDNNTISWSSGRYSFSYTTRFISGMNFLDTFTTATGARVTKAPDVFYHDIEGTVNYKGATFTVGIDNLLDLPPPYVPDQATNTSVQTYDIVGRVVYAKASVHF